MGRMGRAIVDDDKSSTQNPTLQPDEDLYEPPPANYKPPPPQHNAGGNDDDEPPQAWPPTNNDVEPPPQAFPPPNNNAEPPPQAFPPPQEPTAHFPPQQNNRPQPGIPVVSSPLIIQQNLLQLNQPWEADLFDCMENPENAIVTCFFPCVTFGQIAEVLDNGGTSCATSGMLYSLITFCIGMPCLITYGYRSKLRARFGLAETPAPDCLLHCFCGYCALCQEYRELKKKGLDPAIGHAGNAAKQQQMRPPMQQRMI